MRPWMSCPEVRKALAVGQPRVSQLVREGHLVADFDESGRLKYDRESVERYARKRAIQLADVDPEERAAKQAEAQHRMAKLRKQAAEEKEARQAREDDLKERAVKALELIAKKIGSQ